MADPTEDYLPLSALNDFLFCERRAALHLIERIWKDNQYTLEGSYAHRRVDVEANLKQGDRRNVTGMALVSHRLGVVGKADLIEFRQSGGSSDAIPYPVDFKRGKKRRWDNNEVQLCAQALCLEEMLDLAIPRGAIFHVRSGRREEVLFDTALRQQTEDTILRLRAMQNAGITPKAKYHSKCRGCSLFEHCMPKAFRPRATAGRYLERLTQDIDDFDQDGTPSPA